MNNRIWIIGTAILSVAVIVLGWFLGIAPKLAESTLASFQRTQVDGQNAQHAADLAALKEQFSSIEEIRAHLNAAEDGVPNNDESDLYYDELHAYTKGEKLSIDEITFAAPVPYAAIDPLSAEVGEAGAVADPVTDPVTDPVVDDPNAGDDGGTTTSAGTPAVAGTSTNSLVTPSNFYTVEVSMRVSGAQNDVLEFITNMREADRLFLLTTIDPNDSEDIPPGFMDSTIKGLIYVVNDGSNGIYNAAMEGVVPADTETPDPAATDAPVEGEAADPAVTETPAPTETPVP